MEQKKKQIERDRNVITNVVKKSNLKLEIEFCRLR